MVKITDREKAESIIREQISDTILQDTPKSSVFMSMATRLPNMTAGAETMPVLDLLPMVYTVEGDTGLKQTTRMGWDKVKIIAGEFATILPVPDAVLADSKYDIFGQALPQINAALGAHIDKAIFTGDEKPLAWQNDIITAARQAGNNVSWSSASDLYDKLLGEDGVWAKLEESGYSPNGAVSALKLKSRLRSLRDANGNPIYNTNMQGATPYAIDGIPLTFPVNGGFDTRAAQLIVGDFSKAVYSIRQDVTVKILTESVIQDASGKIIYNLMQQDMTAIRVVMRMGWAIPNYATPLDPNRISCPFAYLEPETPVSTHAVKFTVTDGTNPVLDAIVDVNGSRLVTDDSGIATFSLRSGTYPCKIKAEDYKPVSETVVVGEADVDRSVTLISNNPAAAATASTRAAKSAAK